MCLTDTSLYSYICVKHFGMENIKEMYILAESYAWELSSPFPTEQKKQEQIFEDAQCPE